MQLVELMNRNFLAGLRNLAEKVRGSARVSRDAAIGDVISEKI
jgi:hypothetical protein